jgi:hypothetical protein
MTVVRQEPVGQGGVLEGSVRSPRTKRVTTAVVGFCPTTSQPTDTEDTCLFVTIRQGEIRTRASKS